MRTGIHPSVATQMAVELALMSMVQESIVLDTRETIIGNVILNLSPQQFADRDFMSQLMADVADVTLKSKRLEDAIRNFIKGDTHEAR